jgi:hypothetical protein
VSVLGELDYRGAIVAYSRDAFQVASGDWYIRDVVGCRGGEGGLNRLFLEIGLNNTSEKLTFWLTYSLTAFLLYFGIPFVIVFFVAQRLGVPKKKASSLAGLMGILVVFALGSSKLFL